jgi:uncharacterized protein
MAINPNLAPRLAKTLNLPTRSVDAALSLLEAGNTVPFIARYRKEATGELDEEELRQIEGQADQLRTLEDRRQTVLASIKAQGKLTQQLQGLIEGASSRTVLEDLYLPYKPRRRTRASSARERGLEGLAALILEQPAVSDSLSNLAQPYLSAEVPTVEDAWAGARDIVAEKISDNPDIRGEVREKALRWANLNSVRISEAEDPREVYKSYYTYSSRVDRLRPHQILAINRGEKEKVLRVQVQIPERDWLQAVDRIYHVNSLSPLAAELKEAIEDSASRLLLPAIERDVRRALTANAALQAIHVFAENVRSLLQQPPMQGFTIMGIDPGFRTGCKLAIVDPTGKVLATSTTYLHTSAKKKAEALDEIRTLIARYEVSLIAIGNGTASRETEELVAGLIRGEQPGSEGNHLSPGPAVTGLHYLIVSEAGASVYSASRLARSELPDMDVSLRGAVSIARRVQDPLAELVKIEPRSIGVGMYQHDVDQKEMDATLASVVESVVNQVGVDVNTASPALLTHISGIGPQLAAQIVAYRDEHGPFPGRSGLMAVPGLGPKTFEQAAGFLRVLGGSNPLDGSAIHPESYAAAKSVLRLSGVTLDDTQPERQEKLAAYFSGHPVKETAEKLKIGIPTLQDIREQLIRPGRDPRSDLPPPLLRQDVLTMDDLNSGMILAGTVRNVVDFGAFVDIGVKQDGLLHRSQIPRGSRLRAGQVITVEVASLDADRGRIGLRLHSTAEDLAYN